MSSKPKRGAAEAALVDQRLVKAMGHPLRQRILHELGDEPASPSELAEALGEPLGNVSYHMKILAGCGAVELVRTAPVRGAVEHFYRVAGRTHVSWTTLELDDRAYEELLEEMEALIERTLALQAQAKDRLAKLEPGERETHATELAMMHFHRAPDGRA